MVNANRYEYMVYLQLDKMLDSGQVYIHDTINYRRLEDDLIPYEYWLANRDQILSQLNLPMLSQPIQILLESLNKALSERFHEVNQGIKDGENKHVKLNKSKNKEVSWRSCPLGLPLEPQIKQGNNCVDAFKRAEFQFDDKLKLILKQSTSIQYYSEEKLNSAQMKITRRDQPVNRSTWQFTDRDEYYFSE
jgi:hypothetical protein